MPQRRPILVLDFDGTVAVGDGPVWAYADAAFGRVSADIAAAGRPRLRAFLHGGGDESFRDGYDAVAAILHGHLTPGELDAAYRESRSRLVEGLGRTPPGLAEFLTEIRRTVQCVIVTNAPEDGIPTFLESQGVAAAIDRVVTGAAKPTGLHTIFPALIGGADPVTVLSVGDVYDNDIAPALDHGCVTALIDRFGDEDRPAHLRATTFPELYGALAEWAADPHTFVDRYPLSRPNTTRTTRAQGMQ